MKYRPGRLWRRYVLIICLGGINFLTNSSFLQARKAQTISAQASVAVPLDVTHIVGDVLSYSVWPPGSLQGLISAVPPGETLYSIKLRLQKVNLEPADLSTLAQSGVILQAFSQDKLYGLV